MKLTISQATFATLLSSGVVLSKDQRVGMTKAAAGAGKIKKKELKEATPIDYDERIMRLKEKLKTRLELRKKLWSHEGYLVKTEMECNPNSKGFEGGDILPDAGILGCGSTDHYCIENPESSLGGTCAQVVKENTASAGISKNLKPLSVKDKMKAKHIMEESKLSSNKSDVIGEECIPGTTDGYIDVGLLNPCQNNAHHVCMKDSSSTLGGTCIDIGQDTGGHVSFKRELEAAVPDVPTECNFRNGTAGFRCVGSRACEGLSPTFIRNNIGCGSCNDFGACAGLPDTSSVGQMSCNGGNACRYESVDSIGESNITASISISDESCDHYYACSYITGTTTIAYDSCNGVYACMGLQGNSIIETLSCNKDGACGHLSGNTTIGRLSCSNCYACEYTSGTTTIADNSCTESESCSRTAGTTTIGSGSCNGPSACSLTEGSNFLGDDACNRANACSNLTGNLYIGAGACKGSGACSHISSANMTVSGSKSCSDKLACAFSSGNYILIENAGCKGYKACYNMTSADYVRISGGCTETYACMHMNHGHINVGEGSCTSKDACRYLSGHVEIASNACVGHFACSEATGNTTIMKDSCIAAYTCKSVSGNTLIQSGSCRDSWSCSFASGDTTIGEHSCLKDYACSNIAGKTTIYDRSCVGFKACRKNMANDTSAYAYDQITIKPSACLNDFACSYISGNVSIDVNSCTGAHSCEDIKGKAYIGKQSCDDVSSCYKLSGYTSIGKGSCIRSLSCSRTPQYTIIGDTSCKGGSSCSEGDTFLNVSDAACWGDNSCRKTSSTNHIGSKSCIGVDSCYGLRDAAIFEDACIGISSCASPTSILSPQYRNLQVSSGSCQGCYSCVNITGVATIGEESCVGFSTCGEVAGNITIGNESCYGLKACSNLTKDNTAVLADGACRGARSCMSMTGYSVVTNSSCIGPQACRGMANGRVGYHSCAGKAACSQLEGYVDDWSCMGYYACSSAGSISSSNIGRNSCNAHYACFNNGATIGNCLCLASWECKDNLAPMDYDGCAPSSSPAPSSSLMPSSTPTSPAPSSSSPPSSMPTPPTSCQARKIKIESTTGEVIQMFEVNVVSENVNVAQGKSTNQSSTYITRSGKSLDSSLAVDGDAYTFSHTGDSKSWWEVDLAELYSIDTVSIVNRWCGSQSDIDGCLCRLSHATVSLLGSNDTVITTTSTNNTCSVSQINLDFPPFCTTVPPTTASPSSSTTSVGCLPKARKIKLQQSSTGQHINLFELEVFTSSRINIAQNKSASQSSTYVAASGKTFPASNVVDGVTSTFSHTNDINGWLEVDLGSSFDISSVNILNRWCKSPSDPSNCLCRLSNATLSLVDDLDAEIELVTIGNTCGQLTLEFIFETAPEFCQIAPSSSSPFSSSPTVRLTTSPRKPTNSPSKSLTKGSPSSSSPTVNPTTKATTKATSPSKLAGGSWSSRRGLGSRPKKC